MLAQAVFVAIIGLAASEITFGDNGSYSYRLETSVPEPAPMPAPEPKVPAGFYYRLISAKEPGFLPAVPELSNIPEVTKPSGYTYRLISAIPEFNKEPIAFEEKRPGYSYRLISNDEEMPSSGFPSYILPNSVYNWFSGLKPQISQYLPQLAQYRIPEYLNSLPAVPEMKVKDDGKEIPSTYSYKLL